MITLGGKKVDAPLKIVQIFWLQLEILHSEQILSKKFDKRLEKTKNNTFWTVV